LYAVDFRTLKEIARGGMGRVSIGKIIAVERPLFLPYVVGYLGLWIRTTLVYLTLEQ